MGGVFIRSKESKNACKILVGKSKCKRALLEI
jgi:hypothetical protein